MLYELVSDELEDFELLMAIVLELLSELLVNTVDELLPELLVTIVLELLPELFVTILDEVELEDPLPELSD